MNLHALYYPCWQAKIRRKNNKNNPWIAESKNKKETGRLIHLGRYITERWLRRNLNVKEISPKIFFMETFFVFLSIVPATPFFGGCKDDWIYMYQSRFLVVHNCNENTYSSIFYPFFLFEFFRLTKFQSRREKF